MKRDLTSGSILQKLLLVAVPIMGTMMMQMAYNLTDMFWLGRLGSGAVAAAGVGGLYLWLSQGLALIGRMGAEISVAQRLGAREEEAARSYAQNALAVSVSLGVLFALVFILANPWLIGIYKIAEQDVAADARTYLALAALGVPAAFISTTVAGIFNSSGNSRTPFYINSVGLVANMILDPLLIFKFGMGVAGAAIATSAAQILVCLGSLLAVRLSRFTPLPGFRFFEKPVWTRVRHIFVLGSPVALENMFMAILVMALNKLVAAYGAGAMAVSQVGSQVESMTWLIGGGFSSAVTAFVGQNYGAGKWRRIRKSLQFSAGCMFAWSAFVSLLLFFFGKFFIGLFLQEPELIELGGLYLKIFAVCQVFMAMEGVFAGAFRGIGKTLPPSLASFTVNILRVGVAWALSAGPLGLPGIWVGACLGCIARGIWIPAWFLRVLHTKPHQDEENITRG